MSLRSPRAMKTRERTLQAGLFGRQDACAPRVFSPETTRTLRPSERVMEEMSKDDSVVHELIFRE